MSDADHPRVIKLPNRETYLATGILRTLREWHRTYDRQCNGHGSRLPLAMMDIDQLETWCAGLLKTWDSTREMMERSGFEVIEKQPSMNGAR